MAQMLMQCSSIKLCSAADRDNCERHQLMYHSREKRDPPRESKVATGPLLSSVCPADSTIKHQQQGYGATVDSSRVEGGSSGLSLKDNEVIHSVFNTRRYSSAVYAVVVCLRVCVSVSVSVTRRIVSKRLNIGSRKQRHTIAQDSSFLTPKISAKFEQHYPPKRGAKCRLGRFKRATFDK